MRSSRSTALLLAAVLTVVSLAVTSAPASAAHVMDDRGVEGPAAVFLTPLAHVLGLGSGRVPERVVLYQVAAKGQVAGDLETFRTVVATTLRDPRGWSLGGAIGYLPVRRGGDVRIWLAAPGVIERAHPTCDAAYSCRVGDDVYINDQRWRNGAATYALRPLSAYRSYVVNHELGHWLGLDHRGCRSVGAPAWVMQQQTISVDGCEPRVWPQRDERAEARRNLLSS